MLLPLTVFYSRMQTPVGKLVLAATERALKYIYFGDALPQSKKREVWVEAPHLLRPYEEELQAYFRGQLREFSCELDLEGTDFQKKCWHTLLRIPYGKTRSYAEIARAVGSPRAFRAVGQANHDNPIPIIVPCHRVITSSGTLGGYGGGLEMKRALLRLEQQQSHLNLD